MWTTYTISSSDIANWDISRTSIKPQSIFTDIVERFAENRQQQHDVNVIKLIPFLFVNFEWYTDLQPIHISVPLLMFWSKILEHTI